ncbi:MAG: phage tail tip lysozyme [Ruminococcus sp.]|nr:phage tail tip lysozyme [Ruminococcus sp.]
MKRYIKLLIGGKTYRFLIDEELEEKLRSSLKNKYQFDDDNNLILNDEDLNASYQVKQRIFATLLNQIKTYNLDADLQDKIKRLESFINSSKTNVYESDLTELNSLLGEVGNIYSNVKEKALKTGTPKDNVQEASVSPLASTEESAEKLKELKEIIEEISLDDELREEVPLTDINSAMSRIVITSSEEEFKKFTGTDTNSYKIEDSIKDKHSKIVVPPDTKLEDVVVKVLDTYCDKKETLEKVITYVEKKGAFQGAVNSAFDKMRKDIGIKGLTISNANYFGDQFLDEFINICNSTGISFETMFADYFNGYSANRKYNSPLDRFMRLFIKFNGGDDKTRGMLEALLVKKAISRHLISAKYNNYLQPEYRNLDVTGSGYVRFNEEHFNNIARRVNSESGLTNRGGAGASLKSNTSLSESSTFNAELEAGITESSTSNLGLGFNSETVPGVPNFEPTSGTAPKGSQGKIPTAGQIPSAPAVGGTSPLAPNAQSIKGQRPKKGLNSSKAQAVGAEATLNTRKEISSDIQGGFRKNALFGQALAGDEEGYDDSLAEGIEGATGTEEGIVPNSNSMGAVGDPNINNDLTDEGEIQGEPLADDLKNAALDGAKKKLKDTAKKSIIAFIKKHPLAFAIGGGIALFLIFLLFIILAFSDDASLNNMGYYDQACNFNETNVTVTSCLSNETLQNTEIRDYVIKMAYIYSKNNNYSDETLKALMIILKTNALSYGGYSSSTKRVTVRACDVYSDATDTMFSEIPEDLGNLGNLYNQVSEYLFISTSYTSSISSLSSANAITLNNDILNTMEEKASSGYSYDEILATVFKSDNEEDIVVEDYKENLFLGDSRTQGMLLTSVINNSNTVYGSGYGYNWLVGSGSFDSGKTNAVDGGINGINAKIISGKKYNIVIWLGVNDLGNASNYVEKYKELANGEWQDHNIYVVSVGPVQDSSSQYAKNASIDTFNDTVKEGITSANLSNLKYIDLGLNENSITSYDNAGVHYSSTDYQNIYNKMISNIGSVSSTISTKLALYKLSDFCTYYNLTENDAYWWPVGSNEATSGNIYGGAPVSTNITSYFGPRIHPTTGEYQKAHGALDIGVVRETPVIATKDGTVNYVNTGCTEGDHECGGSYGNYVMIDHGGGIESLYAHLTRPVVNNGDKVIQGQIIAYSGNTGRATGPHLHFEIRLNGNRVDPLNYVNPDNPRPINFATTNIVGDIKVVGDTGDYSDRKKNKKVVCESLLASGFSTNATIGIMANMETESAHTYDPQVVEYGSGYNFSNVYNAPSSKAVGFGLIQWSFGRRIELIDYAKNKGWDPATMGAQLNFLFYELSTKSSYDVTYKYVTGNYSSRDIAVAFCKNYERPSGSNQNLKSSDSCTSRADTNEPLLSNYVKNNCSE